MCTLSEQISLCTWVPRQVCTRPDRCMWIYVCYWSGVFVSRTGMHEYVTSLDRYKVSMDRCIWEPGCSRADVYTSKTDRCSLICVAYNIHIYIYTYIYTYICVCVYIYIYIWEKSQFFCTWETCKGLYSFKLVCIRLWKTQANVYFLLASVI